MPWLTEAYCLHRLLSSRFIIHTGPLVAQEMTWAEIAGVQTWDFLQILLPLPFLGCWWGQGIWDREQTNADAPMAKWQCVLARNSSLPSRKGWACTEKQMSHGMKRTARSGKLLSLIYSADKKKNKKILNTEIRFDSSLREKPAPTCRSWKIKRYLTALQNSSQYQR